MAVEAAAVSVTTTATLLSVTESDYVGGAAYAVTVPSGGSTVYLGGSGVTTGQGFPLTAGNTVSMDLDKGEALYGIVGAGSQTVNVLRQGR